VLVQLGTMIAGFLASFLGIGGGMVLNPLMLELGIHPQVSVATSAFLVLSTSSSSVVQYAVLGRLPWDYGLWFAGMGLLSSILGQALLYWGVRRYKRPSFIVIGVALTIMVSTSGLIGMGVRNMVEDFRSGKRVHFTGVCHGE
jgi:uncharacterized membrane protein YfcA